MRRARVLVGVAALAVVAGIAGAQESYPTRPITLVAPFPPGGKGTTRLMGRDG